MPFEKKGKAMDKKMSPKADMMKKDTKMPFMKKGGMVKGRKGC
jgi:hypothetical protein